MSMKQRLTTQRSIGTSVFLPHTLGHPVIALLNILIFFTPTLHAKSIGHNEFGRKLDLEHRTFRQAIVEEQMAKILNHLGLGAAPNVSRTILNSGRTQDGKRIREYLRNVQLNDIANHGLSYKNGTSDVETLIFQSTDPVLKLPLQKKGKSPLISDLQTIQFSTQLQQPEVPYHDLVIKSATLLMRIGRHKNKFLRKLKALEKPFVVSAYYLRSDANKDITESRENVTRTFIRSFPVNVFDSDSASIEIELEPHLLSHIIESNDKFVTFGFKVHDSDSIAKDNSNDGSHLDRNNNDNNNNNNNVETTKILTEVLSIPEDFHSLKGMLNISEAKLEVTTRTLDLRKSRFKRQADSCTGELCCRHRIYVSFAEIGWDDWVIAPEGYHAYYCNGHCPARYRSASTFSAVKGKLHEDDPSRIPAPVCAPTSYSSITLTHIKEGILEEVIYPNMIVNECRCF